MKMKHSWGTIQRLASDRQGWRSFVAALYASWRNGVVIMMMMMMTMMMMMHKSDSIFLKPETNGSELNE